MTPAPWVGYTRFDVRKLANAQPTQKQLSFQRSKAGWLPASLIFRGSRLARRLLPGETVLAFQLRASRAFWRVAFESAHALYGDSFAERAMALSPELLGRWIPAGANVLDVGCGEGRIVRTIAAYAGRVRGIDRNAAVLERARKATSFGNVEFEMLDANDLSDEQYDVAVLSHVLEHIDDPTSLLRHLRKIAPRLIVEVPEFGREPLDCVRLDLGVDFSTDADHVREYTRDMLRGHLADAGWQITEWAIGPLSVAALAS